MRVKHLLQAVAAVSVVFLASKAAAEDIADPRRMP